MDFSEKIDVSRAMLYKNIKELKHINITKANRSGFNLTYDEGLVYHDC